MGKNENEIIEGYPTGGVAPAEGQGELGVRNEELGISQPPSAAAPAQAGAGVSPADTPAATAAPAAATDDTTAGDRAFESRVLRPVQRDIAAQQADSAGDRAFEAQVLKPVTDALDSGVRPDNSARLARSTAAALNGGGVNTSGGGSSPQDSGARDALMKPHLDKAAVLDQFLKRISVESPEQKAQREKREASRRKWAAISDGLRAISNLWFTSQYAPHGYDSNKSWSTILDGKLEKAAAEREKNNDLYLRYALGKADAEAAAAGAGSAYDKMKAEQERAMAELKIKQDEAGRKAALDAVLLPHKINEAKGKGDKAAAEAGIAQGKLAYQPTEQALGAAKTQSEIGRNKAAATNSYAQANKAKSDANGEGKRVEHHYNGKAYKSEKDWAADIYGDINAYNKRGETGKFKTKRVKKKDENGKEVEVEEYEYAPNGALVPVYKDGFQPIAIYDSVGTMGDPRKRTPEELRGLIEAALAEEAKKKPVTTVTPEESAAGLRSLTVDEAARIDSAWKAKSEREAAAQGGAAQSSGNNAPPSRRATTTNSADNTPPSRRKK